MRHFIALAIILASCIFTSTASAVDIVREGDIIAAKSANYCYVLDLSKVDTVIPVGNYSLLEALTRIINYDLILEDAHYAICGIDRTMQTVWRVAKNGASTTRPYLAAMAIWSTSSSLLWTSPATARPRSSNPPLSRSFPTNSRLHWCRSRAMRR